MRKNSSNPDRPESLSATLWNPTAGVAERPAPPPARDSVSGGGIQLRRILVLAERFNALCSLRSDPRRLIDLLGSLIASARGSFAAIAEARSPGQRTATLTNDQARCLKDLEALMRGLMLGAPEASRGLGHAMDALLIQCVLLEEAEARSAAPSAVPSASAHR